FNSFFYVVFISMLLFGCLCSSTWADSPVKDPQIPDGEKITYSVSAGDELYTIIQKTIRITENGKELYEITSESRVEDTTMRIDRKKMAVIYSRSRRKKPEYIIENETKVIKDEIQGEEGELILVNFSGIDQLFRGLPFKEIKSFKLRSAEGGDFTMLVKIKKETTIKTKIGDIPCYELELGLTGFWGTFLPKSYFWYSIAPPHYCVKFKGQSGPPGSPTRTIELEAYESK
ncbi:MAG: hypothetical protein JXJ04_14080, partial [Spirochaetales bacterium]|nr:hypothetical protein [Spirochaetales bacterium]